MREDLLGYLLGALEPDEMKRVERALQEDPLLREELRRVEQTLRALDAEGTQTEFDPPPGLVARTLDFIDSASPTTDAASATPARGAAMRTTADPAPPAPAAASGWSRWDSLASGLAAAALIGIILPAILRGRFEARKIACQDHLRELGLGITAYALGDPRQQLPQLAIEGPEAFSGVYAVRLREAELIADASVLWCPSLDPPESTAVRALPPTLEQLHAAAVDTLSQMQRTAGGSYAYSLGVMDGTQYHPPRYQGRTHFAVLGDAPGVPDIRSAAPVAHDRRGVNLLYEDGHVAFVRSDALRTAADPPFINHRGAVEAGVHVNDAALAPSWLPPFPYVRQR